jgi:hypothetical protein
MQQIPQTTKPPVYENETFSIFYGEEGDTEQVVNFTTPDLNEFKDVGSSGVAEIYQCYDYDDTNGETLAYLYFSDTFDFWDNGVSESQIKANWKKYYDYTEGDFFEFKPVGGDLFKYRAEMSNNNHYCLSYIMKLEDDDMLFGCNLVVYKKLIAPHLLPILQTKFLENFRIMVESCKFE